MKDIMDSMTELRDISARMERDAALLGQCAARGMAPEAELVLQVQAGCERITQLRRAISDTLRRTVDPECDFAALPLDELEARVAEHRAVMQRYEGICGRICDAATLLYRLNMPGGRAAQARELAVSAMNALVCGDTEALCELETRAQPFTDLAALLRSDWSAPQDSALLERMYPHYPEVVWFLRAHIHVAGDETPACAASDSFAELDDSAVTGLRQARTDEKSMNPPPARRPLELPAQRRTRKPRRAAHDEAAPAQQPDEPEEPFPMPAGTDPCAGICAADLCSAAQRYMTGIAADRPARRGVQQAVWDRLLAPDEGLMCRALRGVCGDAQQSALIWELHARLIIHGTSNGVHMDRLCDMIRSIWAEEASRSPGQPAAPTPAMLTRWLCMLSPALLILGRWCALPAAAHALMPA